VACPSLSSRAHRSQALPQRLAGELPVNQRDSGVHWVLFDGTDDEWDHSLRLLDGSTPFQQARWGEHRRAFGWSPLRLTARRNGAIIAMVQVLTRRVLPFVSIAWIPGGPVGDLDSCNDGLRSLIGKALRTPFVHIRMNIQRECNDSDSAAMGALGWKFTNHRIVGGTGLIYDLSLTDEARQALLTKNWRHNLRRSFKRETHAHHWIDPDPSEMKKVYDQMHSYKGTTHLAHHNSLESITSLTTRFGHDCLVVRCDDAQGNIIALRGALVMGDRAWDTFAATTPEGRKTYASYKAFWELTRLCRERGVASYDMGGADPVNNRGVYDFKQGTGAAVVRFLGEWEYSQPRVLGVLAGRRIAARMG